MRRSLTRERLRDLMEEIARTAPARRSYRLFLVGGGTALHQGWRDSTIDADLYAEDQEVLHDIQGIKERLEVNVELARPEDFVPPLSGTESRHVFIETIGKVSFFHYDPYAQTLSKVVRGFTRDMEDARHFATSGMVDPVRLGELVRAIPDAVYARYPALAKDAVQEAVDAYVAGVRPKGTRH